MEKIEVLHTFFASFSLAWFAFRLPRSPCLFAVCERNAVPTVDERQVQDCLSQWDMYSRTRQAPSEGTGWYYSRVPLYHLRWVKETGGGRLQAENKPAWPWQQSQLTDSWAVQTGVSPAGICVTPPGASCPDSGFPVQNTDTLDQVKWKTAKAAGHWSTQYARRGLGNEDCSSLRRETKVKPRGRVAA